MLILCVSAFTAVAAVSDWRTRRIPNALTLPVFIAGILFQVVFHGVPGLMDAAAAFSVGFGSLFILWMIGGGGGGDVKLMGALSVWLGLRLIIAVMIVSTSFVLVGTLGVMIWSMCSRGLSATKNKYLARVAPTKSGRHANRDIRDRRIMAFAIPVALATWVVMFWMVPNWNGQPQVAPTAVGATDR